MRRIYFDGTLVRMGIQAVQIYIDCERQGAVWTAFWGLSAVYTYICQKSGHFQHIIIRNIISYCDTYIYFCTVMRCIYKYIFLLSCVSYIHIFSY